MTSSVAVELPFWIGIVGRQHCFMQHDPGLQALGQVWSGEVQLCTNSSEH